MENDKKRLRNQFTKDERSRLLAIMTEYGPLLDDKNISILSRKEIWEIIENKFNENGHSGRTSAQLKKYWQNYKYHSKRAKIIDSKVSYLKYKFHRKFSNFFLVYEKTPPRFFSPSPFYYTYITDFLLIPSRYRCQQVPKTLSPVTKQMVRMLAKTNTEDWARYDLNAATTTSTLSVAASEKNRTPFSTGSKIAVSDARIAGSSNFSKNSSRRSLESLISAGKYIDIYNTSFLCYSLFSIFSVLRKLLPCAQIYSSL